MKMNFFPNFFKKCLYSMQLVSADATLFSKKKDFFCPWEHKKKRPQKLLIIGPKRFFHVLAGCPNQPRLIFHIIDMSQDASVLLSVTITIYIRISDWAFKSQHNLGHWSKKDSSLSLHFLIIYQYYEESWQWLSNFLENTVLQKLSSQYQK